MCVWYDGFSSILDEFEYARARDKNLKEKKTTEESLSRARKFINLQKKQQQQQ